MSCICYIFINWSNTFFPVHELTLYFMHNKCVLIFVLTLDLVSFFLFVLNTLLHRNKSFLFHKRKKCNWMTQWAETNWKWIENEHLLKNTYFNHFNENKLIFIGTLRKLFWFFFFFLRHIEVNLRTSGYIFFINLRLLTILDLRSLALFYENLCSAAGKFSYLTFCGNIYATPK